MDRNGALALFGDTRLRALWLYLFRKSFKDMEVVEMRRRSVSKSMAFVLEVKADGTDKRPFASRFPFSFFLSEALQSMREQAETIGAKGDGSTADPTSVALSRMFANLAFEFGLAGELSADLLQRYAYDFACMHMSNSNSISKQEQTVLLWQTVLLHTPEQPLTMLAQLHGQCPPTHPCDSQYYVS
jgi:hypothetical protein